MVSTPGPRTVLHVSETIDGDVEISLVGDEIPDANKCTLVVRPRDIPTLIEMLRRVVENDDPEDRSTLRNLRPVAPVTP